MGEWQKWAIIVGGILAVIGQWWGAGTNAGPNLFLPLIGGVLALLGGLIK